MKALLCRAYGPPENLVVENLPDPVPGDGEIVVDVAFAGLNFFDLLVIENKYQVKPALPFSPAGEFAGAVSAVGRNVSGFKAGDRVAGFSGHGAARTKIVTAPDRVIRLPDGLPDEKAAGLIVTYATSLHALRQRAKLQKGETLAVLGASGGVGIAAVELGALMGAHVIACASSPAKIEFAKQLGAHEGVDYSATNLRDELKRLTQGNGVDVIYDPVGGDFTEAALRAIAWKGRHLVVGFAAGPIPKLPLNLALLKGCDILGVFWGDFVRREPDAHRANMKDLMDWAQAGLLRAHVHAIYPLEEAAQALGVLARREAQGKVLLRL